MALQKGNHSRSMWFSRADSRLVFHTVLNPLFTFLALCLSVLGSQCVAYDIAAGRDTGTVAVDRSVGEALVTPLFHLPPPTWFENLIQRPNGDLLVTEMSGPKMWTFDPFAADTNGSARVVADISGYEGLLGIARIFGSTTTATTTVEEQGEEYAVIAGNFSLGLPGEGPVGSTPGSYAIWRVSFPDPVPSSNGERCNEPVMSKIADVPGAAFLNGMDALPGTSYVLMADSTLGVVFRFDTNSGESDIVIDDPLMKKCNSSVLEGINGLKYNAVAREVWFTNAYCGFLAKVAVDPSTGRSIGKAEIVGDPALFMDDFDFGPGACTYLAGGEQNEIFAIGENGTFAIVAGSQAGMEIAEPTAVRTGRTIRDRRQRRLYVSTGGALGNPYPGNRVVGAQVVAIELA